MTPLERFFGKSAEHLPPQIGHSTRYLQRKVTDPTQLRSPAPQDGTTYKPSRHEVLVLMTLAVLSFVTALDSTTIVTALPVSLKLHMNAAQV